MVVAFGGIGLLGLAGFLYMWFTTSPRRKTDAHASDTAHPSSRR